MSIIEKMLPSLRNQEFYNQIVVLLESLNVEYSIIKGEALSKQAYGVVGKRMSSDIDILVPREKLYCIEQCLLSNGFFFLF